MSHRCIHGNAGNARLQLRDDRGHGLRTGPFGMGSELPEESAMKRMACKQVETQPGKTTVTSGAQVDIRTYASAA